MVVVVVVEEGWVAVAAGHAERRLAPGTRQAGGQASPGECHGAAPLIPCDHAVLELRAPAAHLAVPDTVPGSLLRRVARRRILTGLGLGLHGRFSSLPEPGGTLREAWAALVFEHGGRSRLPTARPTRGRVRSKQLYATASTRVSTADGPLSFEHCCSCCPVWRVGGGGRVGEG